MLQLLANVLGCSCSNGTDPRLNQNKPISQTGHAHGGSNRISTVNELTADEDSYGASIAKANDYESDRKTLDKGVHYATSHNTITATATAIAAAGIGTATAAIATTIPVITTPTSAPTASTQRSKSTTSNSTGITVVAVPHPKTATAATAKPVTTASTSVSAVSTQPSQIPIASANFLFSKTNAVKNNNKLSPEQKLKITTALNVDSLQPSDNLWINASGPAYSITIERANQQPRTCTVQKTTIAYIVINRIVNDLAQQT